MCTQLYRIADVFAICLCFFFFMYLFLIIYLLINLFIHLFLFFGIGGGGGGVLLKRNTLWSTTHYKNSLVMTPCYISGLSNLIKYVDHTNLCYQLILLFCNFSFIYPH